MKNRQRDVGALKEQYRYLLEQYKQVQIEKQKVEQDNLDRIQNDRQEVDRLIRELDQAKADNIQSENEQEKLLEQIYNEEQTVAQKSIEISTMRQNCNVEDQKNLNLRKEVEYQESLVGE